MKDALAIHWFRQDLRLADNPSIRAASRHNAVLPIYILDDEGAGEYAKGAASRWWLYHSLRSLNQSVNGALSLYMGNPRGILDDLITRYNVKAVYWNRCYEPWCMHRDMEIKAHLKSAGITAESFNGSLLWEPWTIKKNDGDPYKKFTPFYRKGCLGGEMPRTPLQSPKKPCWQSDQESAHTIDQLKLLPNIRWDKQLEAHWTIGEAAAQARLSNFIGKGLPHYKEGRNWPGRPYVSRLSPHLHFGEISPNQIWHAIRNHDDDAPIDDVNVDHFCSELGWREFSYNLLYYNPDLPKKNLQPKFDEFPWISDGQALRAWQKGMTGIPMIDAGMRELWQTGYMHNRVRMIASSFLVKNLRLNWRHGERWFWDTLIDADLANNSAGWQWIAGCGADAAPYFRIFNPVMQGQKFDPQGDYVRRFVPEIQLLPNAFLFNPWQAPASILKEAQIELGVSYPMPIVDLKASRQAALAAFRSLN